MTQDSTIEIVPETLARAEDINDNISFLDNKIDTLSTSVNTSLATKQNIGNYLTHTANTAVGSSTAPVYIAANGAATACGSSLAVSITGNAATATSATKATKDGSNNTITSTYATKAALTSKGNATTPIYFNQSGEAVTINSYGGNAATATKATQDGSGNVITSTYATKTELDGKQAAGSYVTGYSKGSATQPCYINSSGVATACTYFLNKSVPSDAKFTDTTYTAGTSLSLDNNNNKFNHLTSSGNKHIPVGGSSDQILRYSSDGTAVWGSGITPVEEENLLPTATSNKKVSINVSNIARAANVELSSTLLGSHYSSGGCGYLYFTATSKEFISLKNVTRNIVVKNSDPHGAHAKNLYALLPIKINDIFQMDWDADVTVSDKTLVFIPSESSKQNY